MLQGMYRAGELCERRVLDQIADFQNKSRTIEPMARVTAAKEHPGI